MKRERKSLLDRATVFAAIISAFATLILAITYWSQPNTFEIIVPFTIPANTTTPFPTETPFLMITPTKTAALTINTPNVNVTPEIGLMQTEISQMHIEIKNIQQKVDTLSNNHESSEITVVNKKIAIIDTRLSSIEQVILDDPAKALSIVLIRKDIESIQQRQDENMQAQNNEINRVFGLNQWFLGIMIPMAISVVGLSLRNFFGNHEVSKDKTENNKSSSSDKAEEKSGKQSKSLITKMNIFILL